MKLSYFDYQISQEQIAQFPLTERDSSKLLVTHKSSNRFEHRIFRDIVSYFNPGDVLVLNDTRVLPARLFGVKSSGGKVEIMLLKELSNNTWEALVKGLREGKVILSRDIMAHVSRLNEASARVTFEFVTLPFIPSRQGRGDNSPLSPCGRGFGRGEFSEQTFPDIKYFLHKIGVIPLPPYIKREAVLSDSEQYQTVYANKEGAIAAPTAGLHFTERLLNIIKEKGVSVETITLHVGYGTFKPVKVNDIREHKMDEEYYEIPEAAAHAITRAKAEDRKVIAVGTTVTRALESSVNRTYWENLHKSLFAKEGLNELPPFSKGGKGGFSQPAQYQITPGPGKASIFICPGYRFKIIDALVTNFHLPKSTPMMLTSAFAGLNTLKQGYSEAQKAGYRFFSYGDAMLIL
ncbi:MAG: S-adenosylmethionine:tRNA ribosyltransferase-isomerase [Nitrospirae bacterium]|nr:S-adenosylmethionine:tRNA ribosyltransferase-isomerase [Nitrospirota bacterium]